MADIQWILSDAKDRQTQRVKNLTSPALPCEFPGGYLALVAIKLRLRRIL